MNRLQLSTARKWISRTRPLRLNSAPPRPSPSPAPSFDTLATLPASASLQAPVSTPGTRSGAPNAAATPLQLDKQPSAAGKKRFLGVELPTKPPPPGEEGESIKGLAGLGSSC